MTTQQLHYLVRPRFLRFILRGLGIACFVAGLLYIFFPDLFLAFAETATSAALTLGALLLLQATAIRIRDHNSHGVPSEAPPDGLEYADLIDLFRHWDTRVSHQENIFFPATVAPLVAVFIGWNNIGANATFGAALASLLIYISYLTMLQRITAFQDRIFPMVEYLRPGFHRILAGPSGWLGVRPLRVLGLPFLAIVWTFTLFEKFYDGINPLSVFDWYAVLMPLFLALLFTRQLWQQTPNI